MDYQDFIQRKQFKTVSAGFDCDVSAYPLFEYQRDIVRWACNRGKAAVFADTGMGKTIMQLAWADQVAKHTGNPVLILAPLAVSDQTIAEGEKFGIQVEKYRFADVFGPHVFVTNYEQIHNVNVDQFGGVVLDESSILKGMNGKLRKQITEGFSETPYRLSCTATPSPNDFMELGTQSEFLGIMSQTEMLAMFFVHDGSDTSKWRLKGHGRRKFFEWVATWAVFISKPSDLGYDDEGHELPELIFREHVIDSGITDGLFAPVATGLLERNRARKDTVDVRVEQAAQIANGIKGDCIVWCNLNDESGKLAKEVNNSVEVRGSDSPERKVSAVHWFLGMEEDQCQKTHTSKNTIEKTDSRNLNIQKSGNPKTGSTEKNTCESIGKKICKNGNEPQNNKPRSTGGEGRGTQETSNIENSKSRPLQNLIKITRKSDLSKDLESMESLQTNLGRCSKSRVGFVRSADHMTPDARTETGSMLTTATSLEESVGYCASPATMVSENSETALNYSEGQQNISKKVLISKPSMFGYGLNLQSCNQMIFVGLSDSWEQFYQAVRRCWRYGQDKPVYVHIVSSDVEGAVVTNIKRKEALNRELKEEMIAIMKDKTLKQLGRAEQERTEYIPEKKMAVPAWI